MANKTSLTTGLYRTTFQKLQEEEHKINPSIEKRILEMNLEGDYRKLEDIQIEGKGDQIWLVAKKHANNEKLRVFIEGFCILQERLQAANLMIEEDDQKEFQAFIDEKLVIARDSSSNTLLHNAVLKRRHQMVAYIASKFPNCLNIPLKDGCTAAHLAAVQQNTIYDILTRHGADIHIPDGEGITAAHYRENAEDYFRPTSAMSSISSLMMNGFSFEDASEDLDAPKEKEVENWLAEGDVQKLEQLLLDGRVHLLLDKTSVNPQTVEFLKGVPQYQGKIDAILKAVDDGDLRRVKSLIDREQLSVARNKYGMTPLHRAVLHEQTNVVRYLLTNYPGCVNAADHNGRTALHYAASAEPSSEVIIKMLQKAGGDAFIEDKRGHSPFYYRNHDRRLDMKNFKENAIMNQLLSGELSRLLLQDLEEDILDWIRTSNVVKLEELVLNGYGDLLLGQTHEAEDQDVTTFLEVLPQYQAKIRAIHKAIESNNTKALKLLVDRKKLALCRDEKGLTPLHKAVVFKRNECAKYLIRNYPQTVNSLDQKKRTPLHYAAALRDGGYLYKAMRKAGADPNSYDCNGRCPKYYIKHTGEINFAEIKLDKKTILKQLAHNRIAPSYMETNIEQWLRDGNVGKLEQLVTSGCGDMLENRTTQNADSVKFLELLPNMLEEINNVHQAVKDGDLEKVKAFITNKKTALARDRYGCTPLHNAIIYEQTEIIRYIAANFPFVLNAPDYNKRTPMHYAAAARDGGHYAKILNKAGADPLAIDNEGRTPDYYRRNGIIDLKLMKERGKEKDILSDDNRDDESVADSFQSGESNSNVDLHDDDEDSARQKFEKFVEDRVNVPISDNGLYLTRTVLPQLTNALAELLLRRPADPLAFITDWFIKHREEDSARSA